MRRLKGDVLKELPDKIENKIVVDLNDEQKKVYMAHLNRYKEELSEIYKKDGYQKNQMKTLAALTRLRQVCLDPGLFMENYHGGSSKLDLLRELLEELMDGQHRVLIFSQFTSMLANVKELLASEGIDYYYLDGKTKAIERNKMVDKYNADATPVFLISLKAGGTGLNLTGADTVIHLDPWWNPAVEQQATDRAHRIGQTKTVHVIKIVTKGTIEEKIYELQERKRELINSVIQPGETFITGLSENEIRSLFS
jgi:SNF2 family DNA or RNA helicase